MKNFSVILAVCTAITLSCVSCGDKKDGTGKQAKSSVDAKTITDDGSDKAANDYLECFLCEKSGETYYALTSPDEYINKLKNDDEWDDIISEFDSDQEIFCANYEVRSKEVKRGNKLTDDELASAEAYFEDAYNCSVEAVSGYEYSINAAFIVNGYGEESTSIKVCAVNLDEGWKIIEMPAADLKD